MGKTKWIKNDRNYTLKDLKGNVLLEVEDRTCSGSYITDEILESLASDYFQKELI